MKKDPPLSVMERVALVATSLVKKKQTCILCFLKEKREQPI
jgi:hypothetical protein